MLTRLLGYWQELHVSSVDLLQTDTDTGDKMHAVTGRLSVLPVSLRPRYFRYKGLTSVSQIQAVLCRKDGNGLIKCTLKSDSPGTRQRGCLVLNKSLVRARGLDRDHVTKI